MDRKQKENRVLDLLKISFLADAVKDILKKNLKKYPEDILNGISESLSREQVLAEKLAAEILGFEYESQKRWDELAKTQLEEADVFVEKAAKELAG